jgi:uncharacterized membrane protein/Mg-chelatase subunit ChlD
MGLLFPELLLLLLPAAWWWWRSRDASRVTNVVRAVVLLLLGLALAAPYLRTAAAGRDLVVVVDRSRSQPHGTDAQALELIALAESERTRGDRVAVVSFGAAPAVEQLPSDGARFGGFKHEVDRDGSDLGSALETALELVPRGRAGSVLLLSDGENNGADPLDVARRARARGVRVDTRATPRPAEPDLSIERIELPEDVAVGEPFQFSVWVRADQRVETEFSLVRAGQTLSSGRRVFEQGLNRLVFRDVLGRGGTAQYDVALGATDDRVPENNHGVGVLRVRGPSSLLVVNDDGGEDTLVKALRAAGLEVSVSSPERAPLDRVGLTAFRAVILEDVAAARVGRAMESLRDFVTERGGGLMLTGGRASFGVGGYYKSPLDPLLPVSMEMRQEHRKLAIALAISLDRSGSMGMEVSPGVQKMDLADLGTVAAIELLSPYDSVAVIAVDSAAHVIQPLAKVADAPSITGKVRQIRSMGGGIYCYTALVAAARELENAEQLNRHMVLFADADDSEEQEGCAELVRKCAAAGTSLSVIALGTEKDSGANFLKEIARIGGGEAHFTDDPKDLPRVFALDTLKSARAMFVEEPTSVTLLPDLFAMGEVTSGGFPDLAGYDLTWLRPGATAGAVTTDEYKAPIVAFHPQALGRVAAYTGQIGGKYGGAVVAWPGFGTLFVTLARWLVGQEEPQEFFTSVRRVGKTEVVSVELDRSVNPSPDTSLLEARVQTPDGKLTTVALDRVGENRFEARVPLEQAGVALGVVRLAKDRFVSLPPLALPYSPEFERSLDPSRGERLLREIARESGGMVAPAAADLFRGERNGNATRMVARELALAAIVLLLLEIAGRRLQLWSGVPVPRWAEPAVVRVREGVRAVGRRVIPLRARARLRDSTKAFVPSSSEAATPNAGAEPVAAATAAKSSSSNASPPKPPPTVLDALAKAKRSAGRELDR